MKKKDTCSQKKKKTRTWPRKKESNQGKVSTKKKENFKILLLFFYKFPPRDVEGKDATYTEKKMLWAYYESF